MGKNHHLKSLKPTELIQYKPMLFYPNTSLVGLGLLLEAHQLGEVQNYQGHALQDFICLVQSYQSHILQTLLYYAHLKEFPIAGSYTVAHLVGQARLLKRISLVGFRTVKLTLCRTLYIQFGAAKITSYRPLYRCILSADRLASQNDERSKLLRSDLDKKMLPLVALFLFFFFFFSHQQKKKRK